MLTRKGLHVILQTILQIVLLLGMRLEIGGKISHICCLEMRFEFKPSSKFVTDSDVLVARATLLVTYFATVLVPLSSPALL